MKALYAALLVLLWALLPAIALAGPEKKCTELGIGDGLGAGGHCVCSEPLNGNTFSGGSTAWEWGSPGHAYDMDDSDNATECYNRLKRDGNDIEMYCASEPGMMPVSAASQAAYLPSAAVSQGLLQYVLRHKGNSICHIGLPNIFMNKSTGTTYCIRHYRRWDTASTLPPCAHDAFPTCSYTPGGPCNVDADCGSPGHPACNCNSCDPGEGSGTPVDSDGDGMINEECLETQQKVSDIGGCFSGACTPNCKSGCGIRSQWSMGPTRDGVVGSIGWSADSAEFGLASGTTFGLANALTDCTNNFCRFEVCLDLQTNGTVSTRAKVAEISPGDGSIRTSPVISTAPGTPVPTSFTTVNGANGGLKFFTQFTSGVIDYATHYMIVRKPTYDPTYWIGAACEVEGGCSGSVETWNMGQVNLSPVSSCIENATSCDDITMSASASGTAQGSTVWGYDCDTSVLSFTTIAGCNDQASCNMASHGVNCDYSGYTVTGASNNVTMALRSTKGTTIATGQVTFSIASATGSGNVAQNATTSVSTTYPNPEYDKSNLIDQVFTGYPGDRSGEWASTQTSGAWAQLDWSPAVTVDRVKLYDRPLTSVSQITSGTLLFSDGSTVAVGSLPDNGAALEVTFPVRTITSVRFTANTTVGTNVGLMEFEVYEAEGGAPPTWALSNFSMTPPSCVEGDAACNNIQISATASGTADLISSWEYDCNIDGGYSGTAADTCEGTGDLPDDDGNAQVITQTCSLADACPDFSGLADGPYTAKIVTMKNGVQDSIEIPFTINPAPDPTWGCASLTLADTECVYGDSDCDTVGFTFDEDGTLASGTITRTRLCYPGDEPTNIPSDTGCLDSAADCVRSGTDGCNMGSLASGIYPVQVCTSRGGLFHECCSDDFTVTPRPASATGASVQ